MDDFEERSSGEEEREEEEAGMDLGNGAMTLEWGIDLEMVQLHKSGWGLGLEDRS